MIIIFPKTNDKTYKNVYLARINHFNALDVSSSAKKKKKKDKDGFFIQKVSFK